MMVLEYTLFSSKLISIKIQDSLPGGYKCRPLQQSNFTHGCLEVLMDLAQVGEITEEEWIKQYDYISTGIYIVLVIVDESKDVGEIVATRTLVVEIKLQVQLVEI